MTTLAARTALILIAVTTFLSPAFAQDVETPPSRQLPTSQGEITLSYAPLVKRAAPAVVNIYTERVVRRSVSPFANDPLFREFFGRGPSRERVEGSLGSGVIVGSDGVIVTNAHVVDGADSLKVILSDRREFEAELVLADERTDLAVLRIEADGEALPTLEYADTRELEVGDLVLAIGNPFGVGQTVTSGILSATARTDVGISDFAFFLQTDAAINPGNSGGALIDMRGQLLGVNTAIYSRSGGSNGIGFTIPAEMVRRVVDAAVNEGRIVRPWLGLKGDAVTSDMAASLGLNRPVGVLITEIYPDGPAERAGLRAGDVVTAIEGREVFNERGLKFLAATFGSGDQALIEYLRSGRTRSVNVTLAPPPGATEADLVLLRGQHPFVGAEVAELSPALAEELGGDPFATGLLVTRIMRGGYARRFLRPGDVIVGVNGEPVETLDDFDAALDRAETTGWTAAVERNGRRIEGAIPP